MQLSPFSVSSSERLGHRAGGGRDAAHWEAEVPSLAAHCKPSAMPKAWQRQNITAELNKPRP